MITVGTRVHRLAFGLQTVPVGMTGEVVRVTSGKTVRIEWENGFVANYPLNSKAFSAFKRPKLPKHWKRRGS